MRKANMMIVGAAVLWGTLPVFYYFLSAAGLSSMQVITMRFTLAAAGYMLFLAVRDRELLRIRRPVHLLYFVGTGMCSMAFFNYCYITCIDKAGVAVAALLLYTAPVFVMIMGAVLFQERLTARGILALLMTVLGCACVAGVFSGGGKPVSLAALLWGLGSGFGYALYSIFSKFALRHYRVETITAYTALFAAAATLPFAQPAVLIRRAASLSVILSTVGSALLCTVLGYLLYTSGLKNVPAGRAAVLSTVEPVVATVLGVLLLHDGMTAGKLCGIILVLGAVVLLNTQRSAGMDSAHPQEDGAP